MQRNLIRKFGLDRTRGQIFLGSIIVMLFVLMITIGFIYIHLVENQEKNVELYVDEVGEQISGRLTALINEINVLTLQLSTDKEIQELLERVNNGFTALFNERMEIRKVLINPTAYSKNIKDIELYSTTKSIFPIVEKSFEERIGNQNYEVLNNREIGELIWLGNDPEDSTYLLAARKIRLLDDGYQHGGYLVIKVKTSLVDFIGEDIATIEGSALSLYDLNNEQIFTSGKDNELSSLSTRSKEKEYITVKNKIESADWNLEILIPKKEVRKEYEIFKLVLLIASISCIVLFGGLAYCLSYLITSPIKSLTKLMGNLNNDLDLALNTRSYFNRDIQELNTVYNQMVREINHLIKSILEKEILRNKSEIKALHSQINPHFLFNTLDSLYWTLIRKGDKPLAEFVLKLAHLFRYSITSQDKDGFVLLKQEIEQVKRYTDIMKIRWDSRLQVEINVLAEIDTYSIPKLSIQPIVENAIIHGIEPLEAGGTVRVDIKESSNHLLVIIEDNGIGMDQSKVKEIEHALNRKENITQGITGTRIGLFNTHKLIQYYYGPEYGLEIESKINEGTTVTIRLPKRS